MSNLTIEYLLTEQLIAYTGNARTHSPKQIQQIANSLRTFGFMNPVLVDAKNQLIAGHGRLLAAKQLGLPRVPAIRFDHLNEAQQRAYALADNKIAENADWDRSLLRVELEFLMTAEIDFDVDLTGFSTTEINLLLNPAEEALPDVLHETAYWVALEVALADRRIALEELRVLDALRHLLDIDKLAAAAIERGARAKYQVA